MDLFNVQSKHFAADLGPKFVADKKLSEKWQEGYQQYKESTSEAFFKDFVGPGNFPWTFCHPQIHRVLIFSLLFHISPLVEMDDGYPKVVHYYPTIEEG
jgi:hypothetical protein